MLTLGQKQISKIAVVDDELDARQSAVFAIEELAIEPLPQDGPLDWLTVLNELPAKADAAICDHRLGGRGYALFTGAKLVAEWYERRFPALLSTSWSDASIDELRPLRRHIPVVIRPADFCPDAIVRGLKVCVDEFNGKFVGTRVSHRTLVRVEDVATESGHSWCFLVVPAWEPREKVRLSLDALPADVRPLAQADMRLHAYVNLGAESQAELYFEKWEAK